MHDGHFEGVFVTEGKIAHLFFRSHNGSPSTLVMSDVEGLDVSGFKAGNLVFDIVVTDSRDLTVEQIQHLYEVSDIEKAKQLLEKARKKGLRMLEVSASYRSRMCRIISVR
jgi:hypothetical protein